MTRKGRQATGVVGILARPAAAFRGGIELSIHDVWMTLRVMASKDARRSSQFCSTNFILLIHNNFLTRSFLIGHNSNDGGVCRIAVLTQKVHRLIQVPPDDPHTVPRI